MKLLTDQAVLVCNHEQGIVKNQPEQDLVWIAAHPILVESEPEGWSIIGCPNANVPVGIVPCRTTLRVQSGYSEWIRVDGHRVCLDTVSGFTDGTPPLTIKYKVRDPGQDFVSELP